MGAKKEPSDVPAPERDEAYDTFAASYSERFDTAYIENKVDFVWLAKLRKANGLEYRATPDGWDKALANYFLSPLGNYTVHDLCQRFGIFKRGRLDRFGKPVEEARLSGQTTVIAKVPAYMPKQ